jgi:hypothetical protein
VEGNGANTGGIIVNVGRKQAVSLPNSRDMVFRCLLGKFTASDHYTKGSFNIYS